MFEKCIILLNKKKKIETSVQILFMFTIYCIQKGKYSLLYSTFVNEWPIRLLLLLRGMPKGHHSLLLVSTFFLVMTTMMNWLIWKMLVRYFLLFWNHAAHSFLHPISAHLLISHLFLLYSEILLYKPFIGFNYIWRSCADS